MRGPCPARAAARWISNWLAWLDPEDGDLPSTLLERVRRRFIDDTGVDKEEHSARHLGRERPHDRAAFGFGQLNQPDVLRATAMSEHGVPVRASVRDPVALRKATDHVAVPIDRDRSDRSGARRPGS